MTAVLPAAGKHCLRCGEIHFGTDMLCTLCRPIVDYEARAGMTIKTPDAGGPEFVFARKAAERFRAITIKQAVKGYLKYGVELNPNANYDWDNMAEEEAVDLWEYIQCSRVRRAEEKKYREALEDRIRYLERTTLEAVRRLDQLCFVDVRPIANMLATMVGDTNIPPGSENAVSGQIGGVANE